MEDKIKKRRGPKTLHPELRKRLWKKGQSGNPGGRTKESPELKKIKNLTRIELVEVGNLIIKNDMKALRAVKKDPKASVLKVMIAAIADKAVKNGDMYKLDLLLNRLIGKVTDKLEVEGVSAPQVIVTLPSNGREVKI